MNRFFDNLSIGIKVMLAPLVAIVCLLGLAGAAWFGLYSQHHTLVVWSEQRLPGVIETARLATQVESLNATIYRRLALTGGKVGTERLKKVDDEMKERFATLESGLTALTAKSSGGDAGADLLKEAAARLWAFKKITLVVMQDADSSFETVIFSIASFERSATKLRDALIALQSMEQQLSDADLAVSTGIFSTSQRVLGVALVVAVVASLILSALTTRVILKNIGLAIKLASRVAAGNLSLTSGRAPKDATGDVIRAMHEIQQKLGAAVAQIRGGANNLNSAAGELTTSTAALQQRTEAQASALQQSSATFEQLSSSLQITSDTARQATVQAKSSSSLAEKSGQSMAGLMERMQEIGQTSKRTREIVEAIDSIAFQTNILALNAAVEAARAGEQGRGFAVVASEVRNLAHRSAGMAREIRGLIVTSIEQIEGGVATADQTRQRFVEVVDSIRHSASLIDQIYFACNEQSKGIHQATNALVQMESITQANAALSEEITAVSVEMRALGESLNSSVGVFRLTDDLQHA